MSDAKIAVAYARYSSAGQRDVSIEQQLRDIHAFAEREGYSIIREYADHAKSGFKDASKRTDFQRMMSDAEKGAFQYILAWKVDRFGRNREDSAIYKGRLRRVGVSVVYAMEPIPEGAAGVLLEGMLEATAEWYSRNLSENVCRGMHDNAKKCMYNGSQIIGYCRGEDGRYAIDPLTAPTVQKIYADYIGGISAAAIARDLNNQGLRTVRGNPWNVRGVLVVLRNERYTGVYMWGGFRTEGGMPVLIDRPLWERVQEQMKNTKRIVHQDTAADFLLTGKLFCGICGANMVGDSGTSKTGDRHYYYSCLNHKNHHTCSKRNIRKDFIENTVIDFLLDTVLTDAVIDQLVQALLEEEKKRSSASPLVGMEAELRDVEKRIRNINLAITEGIWSSSTAITLKTLEEQAEELQKSISVTRAAEKAFTDPQMLTYYFHRFRGKDRTDPAFRAQLISSLVNSVYVYDDHLRLFVNTVEGARTLPFAELPPDNPSSDGLTFALPAVVYPNSFVFRIAI
mgnify:CR=1 FL=1